MTPIVFLIDRDEAYAEFLELRLIEKYGNKIDIRTVTDPTYFEELFSVQQKADVALVGENMFSDGLRRHQISQLVILCDQEPPAGSASEREEGVVRVDRFSDPRTILNEALFGLRIDAPEQGTEVAGHARVLTVTSAVGGCGKTSVALALAKALAQNHRRVLYLCTEELQSFGSCLGDTGYLSADACRVLSGSSAGLYQALRASMKKDMFTYLPALFSTPDAMQITEDAYVRLVREAKASGDFDVIVLDPGCCCGGGRTAFLDESDQVFVLLRQDALSVAKNDAFLRSIEATPGKYHFVCNFFCAQRSNCIRTKAAEHYTVNTYISEIPDVSLKNLAKDEGLTELTYMFL